MNYPKIFSVFLLLLSCLHATNVDAHFRNNLPDYHFDTDMQFTTDFTLSLVSGTVVSGNPNDLQAGDTVYSGSVLKVTPTVNAKWALSDLDILALYPACSVTYCPAMIDGGPVSTNVNVRWLGASVYDEHRDLGLDFIFNWNDPWAREKYNDLEPYRDQPVTYRNVSGDYPNKEAGANVYCKGTLHVSVGGTDVGSAPLPLSSGTGFTFTVTDIGPNNIETRVTDAECFASVVKHPLNMEDHQSFFELYYYTENQPYIPARSAVNTVTLDVEASGGTCAMHVTEASADTEVDVEDVAIAQVTIHNDADPLRITEVSSSNAGYTVDSLDRTQCLAIGVPSAFCPPGPSGFDELIATGGEKDLWVLLTRLPWGSGGTVLTFTGLTTGGKTCPADADFTVPIDCRIAPSSQILITQEVAAFIVECYDLAGNQMSCDGDNWYWNDGLVGGFVEKDNDHAFAYSTSSAGSSGTLKYESGLAVCNSSVEIVRPDDARVEGRPKYSCTLIPPGVRMRISTSRGFSLEAFEDDNPSTPRDASYNLEPGLDGSLSGASTQGVTYEAPATETSGDLKAYAHFRDPTEDNNVTGAVCFASIDVTTENITDDGFGDGDTGSPEFCTIGEGPLNVYPGYHGWVPIRCGRYANETCSNVHWSMTEGYISGDDYGADISVTGSYGRTGYISAYVDDDPAKSCWKSFIIGDFDCWEFS